MKLRNSLLARSAVVLTVVGFTPLPAAASGSELAATSAASAAAITTAGQALNRTSRRDRDQEEAAPPSGPEVQAAAEALLTATGTTCQVTNAINPGSSGEINIYEVACADGLGQILTDGAEPKAYNCVIMAQQAALARAENPEGPEQVVCTLPENANTEAVIAGYAQAVGITCQIDETRWVHRTQEGEDRYEIGCANSDGYWVRVNSTGEPQGRLECLEIASAGGECRLTSEPEQLAGMQARFASVAPQTCSPDAARFVGANSEFRFYEVKCSEGFGFIAQTDPEGAPLDARDCARDQLVPGGCTLTDASEARAEAAQGRASLLAQIGRTCTIEQEEIRAQESPPDGSPGREIYEFECAEQPLGLMGFFPAEGGSGDVEAYDCFSMDARGVQCQYVTRDAINAVLTSMVTASERNCNVVDFRVVARMAQDNGDVAEVKCDDGRGWFGEFPDDRQAAGQLLPCAAAARQGDECVL